MERLGHMVSVRWTFYETGKLFKVCYFTFPLLVYRRGPVALHSWVAFDLVYSDFRHCNWYLVSLVCISVMIMMNIFSLAFLPSLFWQTVQIFLLTFHWLFLWLSFESCLFCIEAIIRYYLQSFPSLACFFINNVF